jgi:hypothetical protein
METPVHGEILIRSINHTLGTSRRIRRPVARVSTCAWRISNFRYESMSCSFWPNREICTIVTTTNHQITRQPDAKPSSPTPSTTPRRRVRHVRRVSLEFDPLLPILVSMSSNTSAREIFGDFHKGETWAVQSVLDWPARCPRVATCGALCPGGLPYPLPGQIAHQ